MVGVIKTDYVAGDTYLADDHNAENEAILGAEKTIHPGASIRNAHYNMSWGQVDNGDYLISPTTTTIFRVYNAVTKTWETRAGNSDWADANVIKGFAKIGDYLYVLFRDNGGTENRIYRYDADDISAGGTLMTATFFGTSICEMTSDGTDLFFTHDAGDDGTNDHEILRASISGTTLIEQEVITCGAVAGYFDYFAVDDTYIYASDSSSPYYLRKYNRSGALQDTTEYGVSTSYLIYVENRVLLSTQFDSVYFFLPLPI